jgi:CubicO group peptidase (beta-lactamase class C family)
LPTVTIEGGLVAVPTAPPDLSVTQNALVTPVAVSLPDAATNTPESTTEPIPLNLDPIEVGSVGAENALGQHMRNLEEAGLYSGSILVARRGEIILRHGYGMANRTNRNTATTKFRIASLTKQFTAVLILRLHEQGKLNIDDGICSYLEFCPPHWQPITIRQLLSHSSGIPDYTEFRDFDARQATPTTREELIARFRNEPIIFSPGSMYKYSNSGYILLGQILEYITGMQYAELIKNELCIPLGLNDTDYDHSVAGNDPSLALGLYGMGIPADPIDASTLDSAGALYSTIDDLYRWDRALHDGQVLKPETLALMRTPQVKNYALGVMRNPLAGMASVHHDGMASGIRTYLGNFPDPDITVVVLSNYENADVVNIAAYLGVLARDLP